MSPLPAPTGGRSVPSAGTARPARTSLPVPEAPVRGSTFVVKLRDFTTRSWGDQTEVTAVAAQEAAEQVAGGERLLEGPGERANLRARVWKTPYGSPPGLPFYAEAAARPT